MRVSVVALGKIGLPLAVQFAAKGHGSSASTSTPSRSSWSTPGASRSRARPTWPELLAGRGRRPACGATTDYAAAIPGSRRRGAGRAALRRRRAGEPDFGWMDAATRSLAAHLSPAPWSATRPPCRSAPPATAGSRCWRRAPACARAATSTWCSRPSGCSPAGSSPTCASTRSWSAASTRAPSARVRVLRGGARLRRAPDLDRPNGVWDLGSAEAAELAKLAETTYRDVNIGLANQFARFADDRSASTSRRSSRPRNSQPYSHIHRPGIAVGGHCIPVYPRLYLWTDPDATVVRPPARPTNVGMPEYAVGCCRRVRRPGRVAAWWCSARLPRRGQGDGVLRGLPTVEALRPVARVASCTTRCTPTRSWSARLHAVPLGAPVDAAVVQADHAEYAQLTPADLPG